MAKKQTTSTTVQAEPALQFVELWQIATVPQIRTVFDDETLAELAESIKTHGMLQPVLLRPPVGDEPSGQYMLIAGERRLRAARLAGLVAVPALIGTVDEDRAAEMQLIENIQREELTLADTAAGVLQLYERHQTLKPVAALLGKSLPWVSKHLSVASKLNWAADRLLKSGATEDLDLVLTVHQICETGKYFPRGDDLVGKIKAGQAGRAEARTLLAELREQASQERKDKAAAKNTKKQQASLNLDDDAPAKTTWYALDAISTLNDLLVNPEHEPVTTLLESYTVEQMAVMGTLYLDDWTAGKATPKAKALRGLARHMQSEYDMNAWDAAAFILGTQQVDLTMADLCTEMHQILHG